MLFVDLTFVPLVERLLGKLRHWPADVVVMTDRDHMPAVGLPPGVALHAYEDLLAEADDEFAWPEFDENTAAALCYTSGTAGQPKGVLYSHRSTVLHTYGINLPDDQQATTRPGEGQQARAATSGAVPTRRAADLCAGNGVIGVRSRRLLNPPSSAHSAAMSRLSDGWSLMFLREMMSWLFV